MKSARTVASTIALVVAILGMATVPAFAGLAHPVCTAKHHDCGKTPTIAKCCCGDEQSSQAGSTPAQSRVEIHADYSSVPAALNAASMVAPPHAIVTVHTSPPHQYLIDRPTLFSAFLI